MLSISSASRISANVARVEVKTFSRRRDLRAPFRLERSVFGRKNASREFSRSSHRGAIRVAGLHGEVDVVKENDTRPEHAVISTFDLFSIGGTFIMQVMAQYLGVF